MGFYSQTSTVGQESQRHIWVSGATPDSLASSALGTVVAGLAEGQGAQGLLAQTQANTLLAQSGCPNRHHGRPSLGAE